MPKGVSEAFEQLYLLHPPCVINKVERSCQKGMVLKKLGPPLGQDNVRYCGLSGRSSGFREPGKRFCWWT